MLNAELERSNKRSDAVGGKSSEVKKDSGTFWSRITVEGRDKSQINDSSDTQPWADVYLFSFFLKVHSIRNTVEVRCAATCLTKATHLAS